MNTTMHMLKHSPNGISCITHIHTLNLLPVKRVPDVCVIAVPLQMFDWIMHNKGLFLAGYTEIGNNHPHAMELQTQHNHFAMNCMVRFQLEFSQKIENITVTASLHASCIL